MGGRTCGIVLAGWLLVGQRWADVPAWEELTARPKPFAREAACQRYLATRRAKAHGAATPWRDARCVTEREFKGYVKSESGDFFGPGTRPDAPDKNTGKRLHELGYE